MAYAFRSSTFSLFGLRLMRAQYAAHRMVREVRRFLPRESAPAALPLASRQPLVAELPKRGGPRLSRANMITWLSSLSAMLSAGVPLYRAMDHVANNAETPAAAEMSLDMLQHLHDGQPLSAGAARHPRCFAAMQVGLLKVGEATGRLDFVLKRLADHEERAQSLTRRVRSALTYPLLVFCLCLLGLTLVPPFLLEPHFQLIRDLGVDPPLITKALMAFSHFMLTPWPYLGFAAAALSVWYGVLPALARPATQIAWTRRVLKIPKLGPFVRGLFCARFARSLSLQLEAGVPILDALFSAGRGSGLPYLAQQGEEVCRAMLRGFTLSKALAKSDLFSPMFLSVVRSGEETGELSKLLTWLADLEETQLEGQLDALVAMLEPLVMASVGLLVGGMVVATMLPLSKAMEAL